LRLGNRECSAILSATWLGSPVIPDSRDLKRIFSIQVALNDGRTPPTGDAGEAESIYFADRYGATFATDDNAAYDFAQRRLGAARVIDSIYILQDAVAMGNITAADAASVAESIQRAGRHFRQVHPAILRPSHF